MLCLATLGRSDSGLGAAMYGALRTHLIIFNAVLSTLIQVEAAVALDMRFPSEQTNSILMEGEIELGSAEEFENLLLQAPSANRVILNSIGGNVLAALKIADLVKQKRISTYIPRSGVCLSACSYIFFAGQSRIADGQLGVHQISSEEPDLQTAQFLLSEVVRILIDSGASGRVIQAMLSTPPDAIYIFSDYEVAEYDVNRGTQNEYPKEIHLSEDDQQSPYYFSIQPRPFPEKRCIVELKDTTGEPVSLSYHGRVSANFVSENEVEYKYRLDYVDSFDLRNGKRLSHTVLNDALVIVAIINRDLEPTFIDFPIFAMFSEQAKVDVVQYFMNTNMTMLMTEAPADKITIGSRFYRSYEDIMETLPDRLKVLESAPVFLRAYPSIRRDLNMILGLFNNIKYVDDASVTDIVQDGNDIKAVVAGPMHGSMNLRYQGRAYKADFGGNTSIEYDIGLGFFRSYEHSRKLSLRLANRSLGEGVQYYFFRLLD